MNKFQTYTAHWIKTEKKPKKASRSAKIIKILKTAYPNADIALKYGNTMQLTVAVILSAQCTDKKVNEVTGPLFKKYKTVHDFACAKQDVLENEIRQTGFFRNKAKNIIGAAKKIEQDFGGEFPKTMNDAITIPGIARKSANVILGNAYGVVEGIAVDTHVSRITQRWGFVTSDNPVKIPKKDWFKFTYLTIEHGRAICTAQRRRCDICPLSDICPSANLKK
jgi:endonuclease III